MSNDSGSVRVAIIHPWFPQYRREFFESLVGRAALEGIRVDVYHGAPPPEWQERGDAVHTDYAQALPTRFIPVRGRSLVLKDLTAVRRNGPYDLIVVEQAVRNLETYRLLASAGRRLAFWGHGRTYTESVSRTQERLKQWLTRRGQWFFSYTPGGVRAVTAAGFESARTTVVQNTMDTTRLRTDLAAVSDGEVADFRRTHGLTPHTALFIGGLDAPKRIPFLLAAADIAHAHDPRFRLVIAGRGTHAPLVRAMGGRPWLAYIGSAFGREKAVAMASAEILAMPGRVGLVAVDSLVSGRPLVTTRWPWHAPEFEYLAPDRTCVVTDDVVEAYAHGMINLLADRSRLVTMQLACSAESTGYTIDAMVDRFLGGLHGALGAVPVR